MGRKARATKPETVKPSSALKLPSPLQTSGAEGNPVSTSPDPPLSDTLQSFRRKSKSFTANVRRSQRHKSPGGDKQIEPVIQEIEISESEKEDEHPLDEENKSPEETSDETERSFQKDKPGSGVAGVYKSMYISSTKKVEALAKENKELSQKLEHVLGQVNMYEKQSHVYSEVMMVISSLCKINENLSDQLKDGATSSKNTEVEGRPSKKKKIG